LNDMTKNIVLWLVIAGVLYVVASSISTQPASTSIPYSDFISRVESGDVQEAKIGESAITGTYKDGSQFKTVKPPTLDTNLMPTLIQNKVNVVGVEPERQGFLMQLFLRYCRS